MESNSVCNHTSDKQNRKTAKRESDLLITSMLTDWIGRHEVLLLINHKNYDYVKRGKFALKYWQRRRKHSKMAKTQKQARTRNYNFECDWLI